MVFTVDEIQTMLDGNELKKHDKWYCIHNGTLLFRSSKNDIWEVVVC